MDRKHIYKRLAEIDALPRREAEQLFYGCCSSRRWASAMAAARPFRLTEHLFAKAETIWTLLPAADRLEAFAAGAVEPIPAKASKDVRERLDEAMRLYRDRFGFIFGCYRDGLSAEELLAACNERLGSSLEEELTLRTEEQSRITALRLSAFLEK